jgi:hypothetical protein
MRSFISTAAVALAASSLVSAAPTQHSRGHSSKVLQLPLGDGFPDPSPDQVKEIQNNAFGTLSNLPPPQKLTPDTLTSLRLVQFNENFESFYFANFLKKLDDPHFLRTLGQLKGVTKESLKNAIASILAVEELHATNARNALKNVGKVDPIKACKYKFPVDDVKSAVELAIRFTDVTMGTLQDVIFSAATAGDAGFTVGVAASTGDEGEQVGGFRTWLGLRSQSQPFMTRSVRDYAFSLLHDFIVPGTCPNEDDIDLTIFQPLTADDPKARNQDIEFTFSLKPTRKVSKGEKTLKTDDFKAKYNKGSNWKKLSITYFNGQNIITEPVKSFHIKGDEVTVKAFFPQEDNNIFGLALAVLTVGDKFTSAAAVKEATLFGPAPLEVQERSIYG